MRTTRPKLILINGPAGVGKTTIARYYLADHPLALIVSSDEFISNMGDWLAQESTGRQLAFAAVKAVVTTHLASGYDVLVPHLLEQPSEAAELEAIAAGHQADFFEVALLTTKAEATQRLLARGTWGETGAPPVTMADIPVIEKLYDTMQKALARRPGTHTITSLEGDIAGTYKQLVKHLRTAHSR